MYIIILSRDKDVAESAAEVVDIYSHKVPEDTLKVAAKYGAAVHVHMRAVDTPYYFLETEEVIAASAASGAAAHIVHIQSSVGEDTPRALELIRGARQRGLDITTEVYPYTASMSTIEGADNENWQTWSDKSSREWNGH